MIAYLIKSAFCLTLLLAVYHFLLEKEAMHRFKRLCLLASLAFSLTIPLISINIPLPQSPVADITRFAPIASFTHDDMANVTISPGTRVVVTQPDGLTWQDYVLLVYISVTAVLLVRFAINLTSILSKVQRNERVNIEGGVLILVNEAIIPNSFLKYIFVNRKEYQGNDMEPELLMHELVHVHQKHSLDIILIELLKVILWFNPLFILYKKAIQLNHEFLADEGVIRANTDIKNYQNLLLTKAGLQSNYTLASNFNYSITKKRLIMMKHSTSKLRAMLKELALIPLLIVLTAILSLKSEAEQTTAPGETKQAGTIKKQQPAVIVYPDHFPIDSVFVHYVDKKGGTKTIIPLSKLTAEKQVIFLPFTKKHPMGARKMPTEAQFEKWKNAAIYGIWLDGKHVKNEILGAYKAADFVMFYNSKLNGPAKKGRNYSYQVDMYTPVYYQKVKEEVDKRNATETRADIFAMEAIKTTKS